MYHPQGGGHCDLEDAIQHSENLPVAPSPQTRASPARGSGYSVKRATRRGRSCARPGNTSYLRCEIRGRAQRAARRGRRMPHSRRGRSPRAAARSADRSRARRATRPVRRRDPPPPRCPRFRRRARRARATPGPAPRTRPPSTHICPDRRRPRSLPARLRRSRHISAALPARQCRRGRGGRLCHPPRGVARRGDRSGGVGRDAGRAPRGPGRGADRPGIRGDDRAPGRGRPRPGARHVRPATCHHRARRRCLHHARPRPTEQAHSVPIREDRIVTTTAPLTQDEQIAALSKYGYGWADTDLAGASARRGLSAEVVADISAKKSEPAWMLEQRIKALSIFDKKPMPTWGSDLSGIDFDNIKYFVRSTEKQAETWDDLPADIKNTYDKLGIPEAEKQRLVSGVAAQYESEVVYHKIREDLEEQGVIFLDTDTGLRQHPELFREYFGSVIPAGDNKFSALNTAVWSGGSFIYVPKGVHVDIPLQAYFRINTENMGQFERTLIIVDEGAYVHYVEGCTAPIYSSDSLHSAVVEIIVKKDARCRYTTIQNWSNNVYNLVTKRAVAHEEATMEWVDGNLGSKLTMKYPAIWLMGQGAHGEVLSIAFAGQGQHQDAGGKAVHVAPKTSSVITSKSISKNGGRAGYRGLLEIAKGAHGAKSKVVCDALILDEESRSDTYPYIRIDENDVSAEHEATVSKIGEEQLRHLMSRGLSEAEASAMVVSGFVEPITKELPLESAVQMNRLIQLQMEGSVG